MNEIVLSGCHPSPLASYLKALGIFRILAEQREPYVKALWREEEFVISTQLTREELARFFLEKYQPTPILSPWNGRAGYLEGTTDDNESMRRGPELLRIFRSSQSARLKPYRELIATLDQNPVIREMNSIRALKKSLEQEKKQGKRLWSDAKQKELSDATKREALLKKQQINLLRNNLTDEQITWIDAAVAIGSEYAYAPLLGGSGGVEGSMDLGVNFMHNLLLIFNSTSPNDIPSVESSAWLKHAFEGGASCLTARNTAGSLAPGRVGGPNATTGFSLYLNINPWDFVLMIEGAIMFRPSLTRKLESSAKAKLSYPFTVEPALLGTGALAPIDQKNTRSGSSEIWIPLWSKPANFHEIHNLLREGSVRLGTKAPINGLDMARCVARLGADRGIHSFQRYSFLKRLGKSELAIPLARFHVSRARIASADLIANLDGGGFLQYLHRTLGDKDTSNDIKRCVAQMENALFALTRPNNSQHAVQRALVLIGDVTQTLAISNNARQKVSRLPHLSPNWVLAANDGSVEFRIAVALASIVGIRFYIAPLAIEKNRLVWADDCRRWVWKKGNLTRNLARVVERILIEARQNDGKQTPFATSAQLGARLTDIQAFLSCETDDSRIAALLQGLIWADLPDELPWFISGNAEEKDLISSDYKILKPFFVPPNLLRHFGRLPRDARFDLPLELPRLLTIGGRKQIQRCLDIAWRRSRSAALGWPDGSPPQTISEDGRRLLAALAIPTTHSQLCQIVPLTRNTQLPSA